MRARRSLRLLVVAVLAAVGLVVPVSVANAAVQPLVITTTHLADARVGVAYNAALKATGGNFGRAWSLVDGALPAGLTLSTQGRITGTPTAAGPASFTVGVHDTSRPQQTATAVVDLNVAPLAVTTTTLPTSLEGTAYSAQLTAIGGTKPYTWSIVAGHLPNGTFTLSSSGKITGTQAFFTSAETFTVQVTDKVGRTAQQVLTLAVSFMHFTNPTTLPAAKSGRFYSVTFKHAGGCAFAQHSAIYGAPGGTAFPVPVLPAGLKLAGNGILSGVPTTPGTYSFRIAAQCDPADIFAPYALGDFSLTIS